MAGKWTTIKKVLKGDRSVHAGENRIVKALVLTVVFMVVEFVGGLVTGSLALLADAAHMLTDAAALTLTFGAFSVAQSTKGGVSGDASDRANITAAFISGVILFAIFGWLVWVSYQRLLEPAEVLGLPMLIIAVVGLLANFATYRILRPKAKEKKNIKGATTQIVFDILGSVGVVIAAGTILATGWTAIDPVLSMILAFLILPSAGSLVNKAFKLVISPFIARLSIFGFLIFIGLMLAGAFASLTQYTNTMEYCISCHEMEANVYQEYKESHHFKTRVGVRPACADCHVPYEGWVQMIQHKAGATKELFFHMTGKIDTKEKFEAHRLEMAKIVWERMKANDSAGCRRCHKVEAWDYSLQKRRAVVQHQDMANTGETCIDCHKGVAHKDVSDQLEEIEEEEEGFEEFDDFEDFE
jgi:cation diffusion facilitator family transporter